MRKTIQLQSKSLFSPGNAELLYFKQLQNEEERINNLRVANFLKQKQEREARNKAEAEAVKAAKQKGIDHIAKAQKVGVTHEHTQTNIDVYAAA